MMERPIPTCTSTHLSSTSMTFLAASLALISCIALSVDSCRGRKKERDRAWRREGFFVGLMSGLAAVSISRALSLNTYIYI